MARASAFYARTRRTSSPPRAASFAAVTVAPIHRGDLTPIPLMAHGIVAMCGLLVMSVTDSLLAGCTSLLLGVLYQCRPARRLSPDAEPRHAEAGGASVPRFDRRSLGSSEGEPQPEQHEEGSVLPNTVYALARAGPARASTAGAPPSPV